MEHFSERKFSLSPLQLILAILVIGAVFSYGFYRHYLLKEDLIRLEATSKNLEGVIDSLQAHLASTTVLNRDLNDFLTILKARNTDFQNEIQQVSQKISTLEKLNSIDPELLQKYSKVYFLNENYLPSELSLIEPEFLFKPAKPIQIHSKVKPYLEVLERAARADNIDLSILSGYRSFGTQASLKSQYTVVYGPASNRFSADQGYSEHQLGTALDFTTKKTGEVLLGFDKTPSYKWLTDNAYRFGFILSYPKANSYYIFEPWHWRFVGVSLAAYLHGESKYFYNILQRDIDSYLIKIFD